ncbi:MAG: sensor histidine kinase [Gemmatimonadaceae bacterium]
MSTFRDDAVASSRARSGALDEARALPPVAPRGASPDAPREAPHAVRCVGDDFDAATTLEALGVGVARVCRDWRVCYASDLGARLLGGRPGEYVGRDATEALAPLLGDAAQVEAARATLRDGQRRSFLAACRHGGAAANGGAETTLEVTVGRDAAGGLVLELRDGTAAVQLERERRHEHERERRELEERIAENDALRDLARAMAAVPDSSALLETLCRAAVAHCRATGALVAQLRPAPEGGGEGKGVVVAAAGGNESLRGAAFPLANTLIHRAALERTTIVAAGNETRSSYFQHYNASNDIGPLMLTPLVAHDEVLGVLSVSRSTDRAPFQARDRERLRVIADHVSLALWKARLFEEAQGANVAKSNFLATISHELRTPLAALTGYGELLADDILGPLTKPQHETVERMRGVTAQLATMIDEILTYASLDVGRERIRVAPVDPVGALRAAAAVIAPLAQQRGLELAVHTPAAGVPPLRTDGDKLRQILVNLAGNAVKFTDRGSVYMTLSATDDEVRFAVRDTGPGIAPEDRRRLFHPFSQLDDGLTRRHGGTGLGLYIARRLAELLGGHIELESAPGNGSTFTLVLKG